MSEKEICEKRYELDGKMLTPNLIKKDVDNEVLKFGFDVAFEALNKYNIEKDIAAYIKSKFDDEFYPCWQCIVGKDFSVSLTHDSRNFIFFAIEKLYITIFRI